MKLFLAAVALAAATPAMAQTATADPHAGHDMGRQTPAQASDPSCPPEHAAMGHCTPKAGAAAPSVEPSAGAAKGDCCEKGADRKVDCCDQTKAAGKKRNCCEKRGDKTADSHAGHSGR